jgi:hypothetical protein
VRALQASDMFASFDSASVLHAGLAAALHGRPFPHLGHSAAAGLGIRVASRLPWPLLRELYVRAGAAEGIDPRRVHEVDVGVVAQALVDAYPERRYPAVLVGSSNGAMTHLGAAMQVPWLPGTTLLPVARIGDPDRPGDALRFGARTAPGLLERNADVVLHHMHDQVQDRLMVSRMTYFRLKWRRLPVAYERFLSDALMAGAPVVIIEDESAWPVVRVGERHVFQTGAQGGYSPDEYLRDPHAPRPDDEASEAEWGADPELTTAMAAWCAAHGHPLVRVRYRGPQAAAHPVAMTVRTWVRERGEPADRLIVPSFVLGDPWRTVTTAAVPYWTFFAVAPALRALDEHLRLADPYRRVDVLLFQHGVRSPGVATPEEWIGVVRRHGAEPQLPGLDPRRFPHDIGALGRYGPALARMPAARRPWTPLTVEAALKGLTEHGLDARTET